MNFNGPSEDPHEITALRTQIRGMYQFPQTAFQSLVPIFCEESPPTKAFNTQRTPPCYPGKHDQMEPQPSSPRSAYWRPAVAAATTPS
jgi:hypothetical protein